MAKIGEREKDVQVHRSLLLHNDMEDGEGTSKATSFPLT